MVTCDVGDVGDSFDSKSLSRSSMANSVVSLLVSPVSNEGKYESEERTGKEGEVGVITEGDESEFTAGERSELIDKEGEGEGREGEVGVTEGAVESDGKRLETKMGDDEEGESELEYIEGGDATLDSTWEDAGSGGAKRLFNLKRSLSCIDDNRIIIVFTIYPL